MDREVIFIDANVLLETILKDRKNIIKAQDYVSSHNIIISPLSAHLFVYFGLRDGLDLNVLLDMLNRHRFTSFGTEEIIWATKNHQDENFEDALQVACAVMQDCQTFVTFDKKLAQKYSQFINVKVL